MNEHFLLRTIDLALKADSRTFPNPKVGALIVHNDRIIGEGFHEYAGGPHAEVNAVAAVKEKHLLPESVIYVSLEPCNHYGKTPPCTGLILNHKIPKVVVGCVDPNPLVGGKGIEFLQKNGVQVEIAKNQLPFQEINAPFFINQREKRPYIVLKWAESADGFIAPLPPAPFPITGLEAQVFSHSLRAKHHAIMIGRKTAEIDNPSLTNRHFYGRSPIRIVWDKKLKLPTGLKLFQDGLPTLVLNAIQEKKVDSVQFFVPPSEAWTDIKQMSEVLFQSLGICSIVVEGGTNLLSQFLDCGFYDEIYRFVGKVHLFQGVSAPKITTPLPFSGFSLGEDRAFRYYKPIG